MTFFVKMSESADGVYNELNKIRKNELIDFIINGELPEYITNEALISFAEKFREKSSKSNEVNPEVSDNYVHTNSRDKELVTSLQVENKYKSELLIQKDLVIANQAIAIRSLQDQISLLMNNQSMSNTNSVSTHGTNKQGEPNVQQKSGDSHIRSTQKNDMKDKSKGKQTVNVSYAEKVTENKDTNGSQTLPQEVNKLNSVNPTNYKTTEHDQEKKEMSEWTQVPYKKLKRKPNRTLVTGDYAGSTNVQGIERLRPFHVTNLRPDTTAEDLVSFLRQNFSGNVMCEPLKSRFPESYSSFKVMIPASEYSKAVSPSNWPKHANVRHFFRQKVPNQNSK